MWIDIMSRWLELPYSVFLLELGSIPGRGHDIYLQNIVKTSEAFIF